MSQNLDPNANIAALTRRIRSLGRIPWVRGGEFDAPKESFLCEICEKLNLSVDSFLVSNSHGSPNPDGSIKRYLGRLSHIRRRGYCPVCRLIIQIADRPKDQRTPSATVEEDPTCYARWVIDGQNDQGPDPTRPDQHIYVPRTRRLLIYSEPQAFKDGYLVLLGEDAPIQEFFGKQVAESDLLNADMAQTWLHTCEQLHGEDCEDSIVHDDLLNQISEDLRAVDVEEMKIVTLPRDGRFIALSYLWGHGFKQFFTTTANLPGLSKPGGLEKEKLPRTIRDAILLTRMLGERYLWTDSLCLLHDDGFKYHDDWVYARSVLTVVAGAGKDANAGLQGVRKESRKFHQHIEQVRPGMRLMVSHLAEDYISTSQWDSRGWTFQERMLSRRCLIFVNGRIYFQCRRTTFCEDIEPGAVCSWTLDSIDMPTRIFREKPFVQYTSAVELYTRRELTKAHDILDAFEGIQRVLEKRLGTPIFLGAYETNMDASLLWESSKRLHRRPGFSSWSWSGWIGEVQWKYTEGARSWIQWNTAAHRGYHEFATQQMPRIEPPIPWIKHTRKVPTRITKPNPNVALLHFSTVTAFFTLVSPSPIYKSVVSPLRKRLTGPSALSTVRPAPQDPGLIRAGIADCEGNWCGTINLDEKWMHKIGQAMEFLVMSRVGAFTDSDLEDWEGILPDEVEEIISHPNYGVYNVMLVKNMQGVYFREGLGRILTRSLPKALEPGPEWKDILLG